MGEAGLQGAKERRVWIEKELAASRREVTPKAGDAGGPLTKETFQAAFGETLPQGTALVDEALTMGHGGGLKSAVAGKIDSIFGMKGGGIGLGLPSALGVKKALPDTPVVCLSGDGSAMYAIQALWSAAKYDLDAVFVILNNKSYRILKERVLRLDGKTQEHRQAVPDRRPHRIRTPGELRRLRQHPSSRHRLRAPARNRRAARELRLRPPGRRPVLCALSLC